jgi:hypothetical protein
MRLKNYEENARAYENNRMDGCMQKSGKPDQWEGYKTALNPPTLLQRAIPPFVKFQLNAIYKD